MRRFFSRVCSSYYKKLLTALQANLWCCSSYSEFFLVYTRFFCRVEYSFFNLETHSMRIDFIQFYIVSPFILIYVSTWSVWSFTTWKTTNSIEFHEKWATPFMTQVSAQFKLFPSLWNINIGSIYKSFTNKKG